MPADGTCGRATLVAEQCCENGGLDYFKLYVELGRLKTRIFERIMSWLDLGCLDGEESRPLSDGEDLALIRMSISLGNVPKTTTSVRQTLLPMRTSNYWLPVPLVAFASDMLDASIVVWKPAGDGSRIRIYSNGHTRGVFFRIDAKNSHHTRIFSHHIYSVNYVFSDHCVGWVKNPRKRCLVGVHSSTRRFRFYGGTRISCLFVFINVLTVGANPNIVGFPFLTILARRCTIHSIASSLMKTHKYYSIPLPLDGRSDRPAVRRLEEIFNDA